MPNIVKFDRYRESISGSSAWSSQEAATRVVSMLAELGRLKLESKEELHHVIVALDLANALTQQIVKRVRCEPNRTALLDWSSNIEAMIKTARERTASL
jgi:hypothetical protein